MLSILLLQSTNIHSGRHRYLSLEKMFPLTWRIHFSFFFFFFFFFCKQGSFLNISVWWDFTSQQMVLLRFYVKMLDIKHFKIKRLNVENVFWANASQPEVDKSLIWCDQVAQIVSIFNHKARIKWNMVNTFLCVVNFPLWNIY